MLKIIRKFPDSHIISTDNKKFIWTRLTDDYYTWLCNELGWSTIPVVEHHAGMRTLITWYNQETNEWKSPKLLTEFTND